MTQPTPPSLVLITYFDNAKLTQLKTLWHTTNGIVAKIQLDDGSYYQLMGNMPSEESLQQSATIGDPTLLGSLMFEHAGQPTNTYEEKMAKFMTVTLFHNLNQATPSTTSTTTLAVCILKAT